MNDYEYNSYPYYEDRDVPPMPDPPPSTPYDNPYSYIPPASYNDPQPPKKKNRTWLIALCFSLIGSLLGAGALLLGERILAPSPEEVKQEEDRIISHMLQGQREQVILETVPIDTSRMMTPAEVYAANVRSTVGITTTLTTTNFWGYQTTSAASGSGFMISEDGYILTNFHVIEGSDSISVSLFDGRTYNATLIGYDESNDIAVLKIAAQNLVPVILGDSDNLNVGDTVVAIGNPLGELTFSLTSGSISAKDREVTFSGSVSMKLIQTDCAINSGNSGGALFNLYGEVIGVTNAKYSGSSNASATIDNIGFAIPINNIMDIVENIITKGYILKPYAGLSLADLGFEAQFYGYPIGAYVQAVDPNGPAASILQEGDIIVAVGNTQMSSAAPTNPMVEASDPGRTLTVTVFRNRQYVDCTVTLTETRRAALPDNSQGAYY